MAVHFGDRLLNPDSVILYVFSYTGPRFKYNLESQILHITSCLSLVIKFLQESFVPSVFSVQIVDRQADLIKQGRDVKKSTTVLDFMDY